MAKAKGSKGTGREIRAKDQNALRNIPAEAQGAVRAMLAVYAATGKKISPQEAYRQMVAHQAQQRAKLEQEKAAALNANAAWKRENAREQLAPAVRNMAFVRDLLGRIEHDDLRGEDAMDIVMVACCALKVNMKVLERSLMTLGLLPEKVRNSEVDAGYFQED